MKNLKILAKKLLKIKDKKVIPKCSNCERWRTISEQNKLIKEEYDNSNK